MEQQLYGGSRAPSDGLLASIAVRHQRGPFRFRSTAVPVEAHRPADQRRQGFLVPARDLRSPLQFWADTCIIIVLAMASGIAFGLTFHPGNIGNMTDLALGGLTVALIFAGVSRSAPGQSIAALTNSFDRICETVVSWTLAFAALAFVLFALKAGAEFSRGAVFTFFLAGLPIVSAWRVFTPVVLAPIGRKAGVASRQCIVIGDASDPLVGDFAGQLRLSGHPEPTIIRFRATCLPAAWPQEIKSLSARVKESARTLGPGEIFICAGSIASDRMNAIARTLSVLPRAIFIVPEGLAASLARCKPTSIGTHIAVEIRREPLNRGQRAIKRAMDLAVAGSAAILLLPLFGIIALAIKLDSPGPVFFRQKRNGYQTKPFRIFKFRSMSVQEDGPVIKQAQADDDRVTRIGRLLRKTSFDELPQVFNILIGDMSLVGPRPHACAHDEQYARSIENYEVRQHVKPGLTGWAQVHGLRGETATVEAMYERIEADIWYAVNASILLDLEILLRTVVEVFRQRNAY